MSVKNLRSRPVVVAILAFVAVSLGSIEGGAWSLRDLFKTKRAPSMERKIKEVPKVRIQKRLRGEGEVSTTRTFDIRRRRGVESPKLEIPRLLRDQVISPALAKWVLDPDGDGVTNENDNCDFTANPNQQDSDGDGVGDACDNCPNVANPGQDNWNNTDNDKTNNDTEGDACDDSDGDGVNDNTDNCVHVANANQADVNNNGTGDVCDDDCPDPEFSFVWTKTECYGHGADECDWGILEGSCNEGFNEGEFCVTSGEYCIHWESDNVDSIVENCHGYEQAVNFDGDSGDICWGWDGPFPGDSPPGFEAAWLMKILNPVSTAWAGYTTTACRKTGTFHCTITAYGRCGKSVTFDYSYWCLPPG